MQSKEVLQQPAFRSSSQFKVNVIMQNKTVS